MKVTAQDKIMLSYLSPYHGTHNLTTPSVSRVLHPLWLRTQLLPQVFLFLNFICTWEGVHLLSSCILCPSELWQVSSVSSILTPLQRSPPVPPCPNVKLDRSHLSSCCHIILFIPFSVIIRLYKQPMYLFACLFPSVYPMRTMWAPEVSDFVYCFFFCIPSSWHHEQHTLSAYYVLLN